MRLAKGGKCVIVFQRRCYGVEKGEYKNGASNMLAHKGATNQICTSRAVATNSPGDKTDALPYAAHGHLKGTVCPIARCQRLWLIDQERALARSQWTGSRRSFRRY
ncbi:hypothetical protein CB0940_05903 [Cercospora beticola]|uniref:Uncharacterized protein n=1 Tax=Cercospora beticola TaxID=122368 RepID=A0A2G5I1Q4_CERBT|nr:hypothetical protein CB0940_05903 [Cercospora beticola]PIA98452.1 hypothetical protein CB0940_05903 [Cercospora beticola]